MARAVTNWWDGIELWLTQLPFLLQVLLAIAVLLPACWVAAALVDRLADRATAWVAGHRRPRPGR